MHDMTGVRAEIDKIFTVFCDGGLSDLEWGRVLAAFLAAQPPGEEEICAALQELDNAKPSCDYHSILLFGDRSGGVETGDRSRGKRLADFRNTEPLPAAIRALIPKPEPTVEEDLDIIGQRLHYFDGDDCPCPARVPTHEALARLRKRLEEKGKS